MRDRNYVDETFAEFADETPPQNNVMPRTIRAAAAETGDAEQPVAPNVDDILAGTEDYVRNDGEGDHQPFDLIWNEDEPDRKNYQRLGLALARKYRHQMFREAGSHEGVVIARDNGDLIPIAKGTDLFPRIVDRIDVLVMRDGKAIGQIPAKHLNAMLKSEAFLAQFPILDFVSAQPLYTLGFRIAKRGYNAGSEGDRLLYTGNISPHSTELNYTNQFLDAMDFESNADRTNTVAGALTVLLRNHWPGEKPILLFTATKSHAGKETCIDFCRNQTKMVSISYQATDWALERSFIGGILSNPGVGVVSLDNARLAKGEQMISSAFIERFVTDASPFLFATRTGTPRRMRNSLVVTMSTNFGVVSEDILNRAVCVNLHPTGDVNNRDSSIGNPRYEYLPQFVQQLGAEFRGMVERWRENGMPKDESVRHSFTDWAQTVGGILKCSGFEDFLKNHQYRGQKDPIRRALGFLGSVVPDTWMTAAQWAAVVGELGLGATLISISDRGSEQGRVRGTGIVLSNHRDETFRWETDDENLMVRLERKRARFKRGEQPSTRYRFLVVERQKAPVDEDDNSKD